MEAGFLTLCFLAMFICTMVGIHIGKRSEKHRDVQGVLNVDCGDPEGNPYLFLQLEVPIEDVVGLKQATFIVRVLN